MKEIEECEFCYHIHEGQCDYDNLIEAIEIRDTAKEDNNRIIKNRLEDLKKYIDVIDAILD